MSGRRAVAGRCRFCGCSGDSCRLPSGGDDRCGWLDLGRTVCSSPGCMRQHFDALKRARPRKRTPGEIHALMQQEKRERRRAARARKKGKVA